jgi:outer membrane receptor protein involved in Fe transport
VTPQSGWSMGLQLRYVGSFQDCELGNCGDPADLRRTVPRYLATDLFGSYELCTCLGRTTLSLGVNNVANVQPPMIDSALAIRTDASVYDLVGRWFYLRISQRM